MSAQLFWNSDGQTGCDLPGHAPHKGSDTWRRERWQRITAKAMKTIVLNMRPDETVPACEVCKQAAERAAKLVEQQATGAQNVVSCGCCSNGCVCFHHQDTPLGMPPRRCALHSGGAA